MVEERTPMPILDAWGIKASGARVATRNLVLSGLSRKKSTRPRGLRANVEM